MKPKYKKFQIESDVSEQNHYKSNILYLMLTKILMKNDRTNIKICEHRGQKCIAFFPYRQIQYQQVGCVHHVLVEGNHADDKQVPDEAGDDDDGEEDGDEDGDNLLQDLQIHRQRILLVVKCHVVQSPACIHVEIEQADVDAGVGSEVLHLGKRLNTEEPAPDICRHRLQTPKPPPGPSRTNIYVC